MRHDRSRNGTNRGRLSSRTAAPPWAAPAAYKRIRSTKRHGEPQASTVSDFFWKRMSEWGVRRIYGYPGDGINGLMGGLSRARDKFDFIQARHEELRPSWPARTPSSRVRSASASLPPVQAPFICSMASTTHASTISLLSPSSVGRRAPRSAVITSRRSISRTCSRTSPASSSRWPPSRRRCVTSSIAPCASPSPSARSPASSCPTDIVLALPGE